MFIKNSSSEFQICDLSYKKYYFITKPKIDSYIFTDFIMKKKSMCDLI